MLPVYGTRAAAPTKPLALGQLRFSHLALSEPDQATPARHLAHAASGTPAARRHADAAAIHHCEHAAAQPRYTLPVMSHLGSFDHPLIPLRSFIRLPEQGAAGPTLGWSPAAGKAGAVCRPSMQMYKLMEDHMSRKKKVRLAPRVGAVIVDDQNTIAKLLLRIAANLKPFEVEVPAAWRAVTQPGTLYIGECFSRGFRFVSDLRLALREDSALDDMWLVHGEYLLGQPHGWVELPGDVVFDGTFQQFYSRPDYYAEVSARPWYKYAPMAAVVISINMPMDSEGRTPIGNWHDYLKLPWADPENPTVIKFEQAMDLITTSGLSDRDWLSKLGAKKPNVCLSPPEWANYIARLRWTEFFVSEADRKTPTGRARAIAALFDANLNEQLVAAAGKEIITTRLECCTAACSEGGYQFTVLMRRRRPG